jgi:oxepin-CoA hydrolase/3-oxo-5,6-dehydrosuberyl-CoA semialdehyde dehydrogenase
MITLESFVCGKWQAGSAPFGALFNPATEAAIAQASSNGVDLAAALAYGRDVGGPTLRAMTFAERGALVKRMSGALHEAREELILASIENAGATRGDAKFDIDGGIGTLAFYAKLGETLGDKKILVEGPAETLLRSPRFAGYHVRVPKTGVAVHINAFNFPVWGFAEKAACAILAGVPVITKPATSTALVAYRAAQKIVQNAQLPNGVFQFVVGDLSALLDGLLPEDTLAFTGSADTAAKLRKLPAVIERSVRLNVEADSLNSSVLGADVEVGSEAWHLFVRHAATEMTQKTGQKCTATRRIIVPKARIDDVVSALKEKLDAIRLGDPGAEGVDMGPVATKQQHADALAGLAKLQQDGARVVAGGADDARAAKANGGKGWFVPPTLLRHDEPMKAKAVHAHEVFGPVSTVMPYESAEQAAQLVARGEGSLVAGVYSDDQEFLAQMITQMAPWSGRLVVGSTKVADMAATPGMVLPTSVHGGPGRAGGGEELGGERGLHFYMQRTAIQGDRAMLDRILGAPKADDKPAA